jgi:hypothetical protein
MNELIVIALGYQVSGLFLILYSNWDLFKKEK